MKDSINLVKHPKDTSEQDKQPLTKEPLTVNDSESEDEFVIIKTAQQKQKSTNQEDHQDEKVIEDNPSDDALKTVGQKKESAPSDQIVVIKTVSFTNPLVEGVIPPPPPPRTIRFSTPNNSQDSSQENDSFCDVVNTYLTRIHDFVENFLFSPEATQRERQTSNNESYDCRSKPKIG